MSNQLLMSQVILQQHSLLTADQYTVEQLKKRYKVSEDWSIEQIDQWFRQALADWYQELLDLDIPSKLIDPIFLIHEKLHDTTVLNEAVDQEILQFFKGPFDHRALQVYAYQVLDFYRLEKYLRFKTIDQDVPEGYLKIDEFKHYQDIDRLILNSRYYKVLKGLNLDNFYQKTQQAHNEALKDFTWGLQVEESIFSMAYLMVQQLRNVRAFLKAVRYGFDPKEFIYV